MPNPLSIAEDPWWLMDVYVEDEPVRLYSDRGEEYDFDTMRLAYGTTLSVYSIFEEDRLSPISQIAPMILLPGTFQSQAITIKGDWSEPLQTQDPQDNQIPELPGPEYVDNLTRPMWRERIEIREVHYTEETDTEAEAAEEPAPKRQRVAEGPAPPAAVAGTSRQRTAPISSRAQLAQRYFQFRRVKSFYDHQICDSVTRGEVLAKLTASDIRSDEQI